MCYIQLSLLGCAGHVVIADTLKYPVTGSPICPVFNENHDVWYLPMWYLNPLVIRRPLLIYERGGGQMSNGVIITAIICATLIVLVLISNKKK